MRNILKKDIKGVIHNHCSDYSNDATESLELMVKSARKTGIDFIIFTDHNSIGVKKDKRDKNYKGVQVIAGTEITPECKFVRFEDKELTEDKSNGHFLIFDLGELPADELILKGICQELIDFAADKGLLGFLAHPDHKGTKRFGVPAYNCKNYNITGYTGFSLWDLQTDWQNNATTILNALTGFFFPAHVLKGPEEETLSRWDAVTPDKNYCIIGEVDQHAYKYSFLGIRFTIFKSAFSFKSIRTHVILERSIDIENDFKKELLDAMRDGHTYVSLDYFKDATGFSFEAEYKSKKYIMGDTIKKDEAKEKVIFSVSTPFAAYIRVIKDGKTVLKHSGSSLSFTVEETGGYRVEASCKTLFKLRPWIYSNVVRVV